MDSSSDHQAALVQAIKIAEKTAASIELFLVAYNSQCVSHWNLEQAQLDDLKNEYLASKVRWLETYIPEIKVLNIVVTLDVVWHADVSCAVLAKVASTDASMVIKVVSQLGHKNMAKRYLNFIIDLIPDKDEKLQIMYGINKEKKLTEYSLDHLSGYKDSKPVRVGNAAYKQKQNDIYGH